MLTDDKLVSGEGKRKQSILKKAVCFTALLLVLLIGVAALFFFVIEPIFESSADSDGKNNNDLATLYTNRADSLLASFKGQNERLAYFGGKKSFYGIPLDVNYLLIGNVDLNNVPANFSAGESLVRTKFKQAFEDAASPTLISQVYRNNTALTFEWQLNENNRAAESFELSIGVGNEPLLVLNKQVVDTDIVNVIPPFSNARFDDNLCVEYKPVLINTNSDVSDVLGAFESSTSNDTSILRPSTDIGSGSHYFYFPTCKASTNEAFLTEYREQSVILMEFTCFHIKYLSTLFENEFMQNITELLTDSLNQESVFQAIEDIETIILNWRSVCGSEEVSRSKKRETKRYPILSKNSRRQDIIDDFPSSGLISSAFASRSVAALDTFNVILSSVLKATLLSAFKRVLISSPVTTIVVSRVFSSGLVKFSLEAFNLIPEFGDASPNGPAVTDCNGLNVAGNDIPNLSRTNLGNRLGTFSFQYETFQIKDSIEIRHGDTVIFSTGCVGENDLVDVSLSDFSSTEIEVEVFPNCEGTVGTAWNYVVGCPGGAELRCESVDCQTTCDCTGTDGRTFISSPKEFFQNVSTNGCGADGKPLPLGLPNSALADSFFDQFQEVCNRHDTCYGRCTADRASCDLVMCQELLIECSRLSLADLPYCRFVGSIMCTAVQAFGAEPFVAAQREFCTCK